MSNMYCKVQS